MNAVNVLLMTRNNERLNVVGACVRAVRAVLEAIDHHGLRAPVLGNLPGEDEVLGSRQFRPVMSGLTPLRAVLAGRLCLGCHR